MEDTASNAAAGRGTEANINEGKMILLTRRKDGQQGSYLHEEGDGNEAGRVKENAGSQRPRPPTPQTPIAVAATRKTNTKKQTKDKAS
jgi:hypothetical protein